MQTHWNDFRMNAYGTEHWASTDRGWLKALTDPYDHSRWMDYNENTMPIADDEVPGGWREQSTLGNYLDYGPCKTYRSIEEQQREPGFVHAVCYVSHTSHWFPTVREAKDWIEAESKRVRPELDLAYSLYTGELPWIGEFRKAG